MRISHQLLLLVSLAGAIPGCASSEADESLSADDLSKSAISGMYTSYGQSLADSNGHIINLHLRKDGTFGMTLEGRFGCNTYAGFTCADSWNSPAIFTDVQGSWKASTNGVTLQPNGTGKPSAAIPLTITSTGSNLTVNGTIVPNRKIFASMDAEARYGIASQVKATELTGKWKFVTPPDADGFQQRLDGSQLSVKGYEHAVLIDGAKGTYQEERYQNGAFPKAPTKWIPTFAMAGVPPGTGAGIGVIVTQEDRGGLPNSIRILSLTADAMTLTHDGKNRIQLKRQP